MIYNTIKALVIYLCLTGGSILVTNNSAAQVMPTFTELEPLPATEGCAGMFAGVSNGMLFCMGGANFPGKKPWEGGKKKWYDEIYMMGEGKSWLKSGDKMPSPLGYGVSVTYKEQVIVIGGSNETGHSNKVYGFEWLEGKLRLTNYPDLPLPMANMAGTLVGHLIIIAGGNNSLAGNATKTAYLLDLENTGAGWSVLPAWPGRERMLPMCASYNGTFYLFGGETIGVNALARNYRLILGDAYSFTPRKTNGKWTGSWKILVPMPKGLSAASTPLPVRENGQVVFWGGVDALTSLHTDQVSHRGISADVQLYNIKTDSWEYAGKKEGIDARVTLPAVNWNGRWLYISGEIRPAVRSNRIYEMK